MLSNWRRVPNVRSPAAAACYVWSLAILLPLFVLGCSKQTDSVNTTPTAPAAEANPAATMLATQPAQATGAVNPADQAATLATLTQALRKYSIEHKQIPTTFEELVAAGYVTNLPPAPPGQKFAVNPKGVQVILVKR